MNRFNKSLIQFSFIFFFGFIESDIIYADISSAESLIYNVRTPNASDLGSYGDTPISYYTGKADIRIPIYTTTQLGLPLDIYLQYDCGGINPNKLPGWVGTNWTLMSGGLITRVQQGYVDEYVGKCKSSNDSIINYFESYSFVQDFPSDGSKNEKTSYIDKILKRDVAPDVFYFNFMGISGQFFLGNDGKWKVFCERNIQVLMDYKDEKSYSLPFIETFPGDKNVHQAKTINGFVLIDEQGTKYYFGQSSDKSGVMSNNASIEYSIPIKSIGNKEKEVSWTADSWYITLVEDRLGNQLYKFYYDRGPFLARIANNLRIERVYYKGVSSITQTIMEIEVPILDSLGNQIGSKKEEMIVPNSSRIEIPCTLQDNHSFPYEATLCSPIYLNRIETLDGQSVLFETQEQMRTNVTAYGDLYNLYNNQKLFSSEDYLFPDNASKDRPYAYLQNDEYKKYWFGNDYDGNKEDPLSVTGVKMLKSIQIDRGSHSIQERYSLNYEGFRYLLKSLSKSAGGKEEKYDFSYKGECPTCSYVTTAVDHWGYYNANYSVKLKDYDGVPSSSRLESYKKAKEVNPTVSQYGMLDKICFPTGGCEKFFYEQNQYTSYQSMDRQSLEEEAGICGGLRISKIQTFADRTCQKLIQERTFEYQNGELFAYPKYKWYGWRPRLYGDCEKVTFDSFASSSVLPLANSFGPIIGYGTVTEHFDDGSKNTYLYSNLSSNLVGFDLRYEHSIMDTIDVSPYEKYGERGYGRGRLLSAVQYDANGNKRRIRKNIYRSDIDSIEKKLFVRTAVFFHNEIQYEHDYGTEKPYFYVGGIYKLFYPKFDIVGSIDTIFENGSFIVNKVQYDKFDRNESRFLRSITSYNNVNNHREDSQNEGKTVYTYPFDYYESSQTPGQSSSHTGQTQQYEDPRPQWMKDQGLYYYLEMPDWVPVIDVEQGVIYMPAEEVNSAASLSHWDSWRYVSLWRVVCEPDWNQATIDSVQTVLKERKEEYERLAQEANRKEDSIKFANSLQNVDHPLFKKEIQELRPLFDKMQYYPVVRTTSYQDKVKIGVSQTRYKYFSGNIIPGIELKAIGDSVISYTRYLDYNKYGLPTKIQQNGKPYTYLFWDKTKLMAMATSGDTAIVPTYTEGIDPLTSVQYGNYAAYEAPQTQTKVVRYDDDNRIKSITDELGLTQYYEYDGFGRLASVRDNEHRRVASYSYHIQEDGYNYVKTGTLLNAGGTDSLLSIQYYDGLGRPSLTASNAANPQKKFAYALTEYDSFGRESKVWSPVIGATSPDGGMAEDFASKSNSQYNDAYGYAKTEYDALGRVVKTIRPGKDWHTKGKSVNISYGFNGVEEVKKYSVAEVNGKLSSGYYPKGDLQKVITTSEDGNKVAIYKDCRDLTILERRYNDNETIETYYVYNDLGQLVWVLQPKYQEEENLSKFAFHYEYDSKGRLSKKKLPGCEPVEFVKYDDADRIVKLQDGVLRAKGKYRVYEYDGLGRLKKQSISNGTAIEYDEVVNFYDNYDYLSDYSELIPQNNVDDTDLFPEERHLGNAHGQLTGVWQRASNGVPMLMSYSYDDYGRVGVTKEIGIDKHLAAMGYSYNFAGDLDYDAGDLYRYDKSVGKLNDNSLYSWTKHYFHSSNNKLPYRSVIHLTHKGSTKQTNDEIMKSTYDDFGNIVANDRKGTAGDMTYAYDYLHGWLKQIGSASGFSQTLFRENSDTGKRYDGSIAAMSWRVGDNYNRTYHYDYDQVNRLLTAEYSSWQGDWSGAATSELRSLIPMYHNENGDDYSVYYEYDKNTNIKTLSRYGTSNTFPGAEIDALSMTYNGNQLKSVYDNSVENLTYAGAFDFRDKANTSVEYTYNENGAMTKDLNKDIDKIEYDLLGNPQKVTFSNKNSIEYVYAADGRKLKTVHSTAIKIKTSGLGDIGRGETTPGKSLGGYTYVYLRDTTDYINNYVFKNGKPVMYRFPGGYYSFDSNGNMNGCHFYVQDNQGNNRMVVNAYTDEVEQINHYYPYGALLGDISTNPNGQKYKFGGKELDRTYGLDLNDFEARQQDALLGRFTSVDPLSEETPQISPYSYCAGNPICFIDLNGEKPLPSEAAFMANYTYGGGKLIGEWQLCKNSDINSIIEEANSKAKDGFFAMAFEKTNNGSTEYAVAYRGTQSLEDVKHDVTQYFGISSQFTATLEVAESVAKAAGGQEITFIGHSKAGAQAAASAYYLAANHFENARCAITFNAAFLSPYIVDKNANAQIDSYYNFGDEVFLLQCAANVFFSAQGLSMKSLPWPDGDFHLYYNRAAYLCHQMDNFTDPHYVFQMMNYVQSAGYGLYDSLQSGWSSFCGSLQSGWSSFENSISSSYYSIYSGF